MRVRGHRECNDCGRQWSYYDTGRVECPNCGSLRSVGVDERTFHTATPVSLDLSSHRDAFDGGDPTDLADDLKSDLREYVRQRGFVDAGDLADLNDAFLAAHELLQAIDVYARARDPSDDDRLYVLSLLRGADAGERPAPDDVPESMAAARGLGYADAVEAYRSDAVDWLDENPDPAGRTALGTVSERVKRVQALEGDVSPRDAERLVTATREIATYLREGDEAALASARDRL
ncbi:hypothetical protein ACFQJD_11055 [Haloplanus sp. GCM10025708]|uniref:DUF7117 family protein n=1 Tax=Haloferacaceae TaxID=1644056 RepID=UPI0036129449